MKKYKGKTVGILGTLIIHLIAGIIFMSLQINSLKKEESKEYEIELVPPAESAIKEEKQNELVPASVEKLLQDDPELLNIARNLANKSVEKINPADYIDMVKNELIKSGKLGVNNYIDEKKKSNELKADEKASILADTTGKKEFEKPGESQKMASNYKGPTRIYYNLPGRTHTYLPIPIYKCQGSGKVSLTIEVNQNGFVEKAIIISNQSTTSDECLIETAVSTALISRFNSDINSPRIQTGTISYQFVAQ
jgi:hypothetical protein